MNTYNGRFAPALALSLVLIVCGLLWSRTSVRPLAEHDQTFYIGIGHDLLTTGRFTDGFAFTTVDPQQARPSGMRFAPIYPALVAVAMAWEPDFARAADCVVRSNAKDPSCLSAAAIVRLLQFGMLVVFLLLVWWIAGEVLGSPRAGWIALALSGMCVPLLLRFVNYVMTEIAALVLLTSAVAAAVAALRGRSVAWLFVAGLCLGMTALTRPSYLYLAYASALVGLGLILWREPRLQKLPLFVAFVVGLAAAVLPWITRNAIVLGRPALTYGYDSHTLVQRVAYNQMNWSEYGLFYVCGLPGGHGLAKTLSGPRACERFSWDPAAKNSFYNIGNGPLMDETVAAAGGWPHHLSFLLRNYVLASPLTHLLVTLPFALAGGWINHYWGFVLGIVCTIVTVRALREGDKGLLLVTLPGWFMLLFHAGVAINQVRYNLILILPYSIAGASLLDRVLPRRPGAYVGTQSEARDSVQTALGPSEPPRRELR